MTSSWLGEFSSLCFALVASPFFFALTVESAAIFGLFRPSGLAKVIYLMLVTGTLRYTSKYVRLFFKKMLEFYGFILLSAFVITFLNAIVPTQCTPTQRMATKDITYFCNLYHHMIIAVNY